MEERTFNFRGIKDRRQTGLTLILCLLCVLFLVSLFKNISYPLFWADEGMTVMHGKRVLEYGYPKVHDGKNVVYDLRHPDPALGIDERTDAYIGGANWGQYYFATIGIKLAELSDDIYRKTAVIRALFALIGLAGLALLAFLGAEFFRGRSSRTGFLVIFLFLELVSIPLALHLREARYYPLAIFLVSLSVFLYARYRILQKTGYAAYVLSSTAVLLLLYGTFSPVYFIMLVAVALNEAWLAVRMLAAGRSPRESVREPFRGLLRSIAPLCISLALALPLAAFFRASHISRELLKFNSPAGGMRLYLDNVAMEWEYFAWSDLLLPALAVKASLLAARTLAPVGDAAPGEQAKSLFSRFLTVFFLVYFFSIAMIPNALFTRYFIALQPLLAMLIVLDAATLYSLLSRRLPGPRYAGVALAALFAAGLVFTLSMNGRDLRGRVYELTHQFRGPLDHVIPFIKDQYRDTGGLVIATNYEEASFMYYLDAKVIVGFVGNNLKEDSRALPDIIVYRKGWGNFGAVFNGFLQRARYRRVSFPVTDYPVNNIPELNWPPPYRHRFAAEERVAEQDKVELFVRTRERAGKGRI